MKAARCILGIDPGFATTGYMVVEVRGRTPKMIASGAITTRPDQPTALRLQRIFRDMGEIIARHHPSEAAVEAFYFLRSGRTACQVGQARGVILLALADAGIPIAEYAPKRVKRIVAGSGDATKVEVGEAVRTQLRLAATPRPDDTADAGAVALCHLNATQQAVSLPSASSGRGGERKRSERNRSG